MPPQRLKTAVENAVAAWATAAFYGNVPVIFANQAGPKPAKPYVELNISGPDKIALDDTTSSDLTLISGARLFSAGIKCRTDANPKARVAVTVLDLTQTVYTLTLAGVPYTLTLGTPPTSPTAVLAAIAALLVAPGYLTWTYGQDPSPVLVIELPSGAVFSFSSTADLSAIDGDPGDAFDMANTLQASLNDSTLREILYQGGSGVGAGPAGKVQDLTQLLETKFERCSQFDVRLNAASNQTSQTPFEIDTVTPPVPTWQTS